MTTIKRQSPTVSSSMPSQIDISKQPYDRHLSNLKHWKIKDYQTIIKTLQYFLKYKYKCLSEMEYISEKITLFHKDICKVNDKGEKDEGKVELGTEYFQMVMELKARFKKLAKQGCFSGEKKRRSEFEEMRTQKKNLVNVDIVIPSDLLLTEPQQYHKSLLSLLYRSFVSYFPESHNQPTLNIKLCTFLTQLYKQLKRKYFYLKQREYFTFEVEKLCDKLRNSKYLENKKLMLQGKIQVKEIVMNRLAVFQNFEGKRKEQQEMMKILRESEKLGKLDQENEENKEGNGDNEDYQRDQNEGDKENQHYKENQEQIENQQLENALVPNADEANKQL